MSTSDKELHQKFLDTIEGMREIKVYKTPYQHITSTNRHVMIKVGITRATAEKLLNTFSDTPGININIIGQVKN